MTNIDILLIFSSLKDQLTLALSDEELPAYPKNIFKYSRNLEVSKRVTIPYFNKTVGGALESNIIFNPKTIMPKAIMFREAINAMGRNWDIIEVCWFFILHMSKSCNVSNRYILMKCKKGNDISHTLF